MPAETREPRRRLESSASPAFVPRHTEPGIVRVGLLNPDVYQGGVERHQLDLATWLAGSGVAVVGMAAERGPSSRAIDAAFHAAGVPTGYGSEAIRALIRSVDVLYVWGSPGWPDWVESVGSRPAVVLVAHGIGEWTRRNLSSAARADAVVLVGEACRGTVPDGIEAVVILNAIDPARVIPRVDRLAIRESWGVSPTAYVVGNLARVSGEKGCDRWSGIAQAMPDVTCVWVGGGTDLARVRDRGGVWPGPTEDVGSTLAAFDHFVNGSYEDAGPLTLVEAWLAGVPVVATAVGLAASRPDLVRLVSRDATAEDFARAVAADRADPEGTADRVRRARDHALREHDPDVFTARWITVFREVVTDARKARGRVAPRAARGDRLGGAVGASARCALGHAVVPDPGRRDRVLPRNPRTSRRSLVAQWRVQLFAASCPYRVKAGCSHVRCTRPDTDRVIHIGDCLDCAGRILNHALPAPTRAIIEASGSPC